MPAFIETQFPIARLSAESYKERKAGASQTLTGLGKWWGRKPLILVRASILGMLMPASGNPKKDREIYLKILTMDDDGAWLRNKGKIKDRKHFDTLTYAERIAQCERPENIEGPTTTAWAEINDHLGTSASNLSSLINELGIHSFGHSPKVGDSFCGGGSIPFEAARMGCDSFGSDLNPVAGLLTWASLNLLGGGDENQTMVRRAQEKMFEKADRQITDWGIEHNSCGERADVYFYCVEVKPEGCDYFIPLAPNWVISDKHRIVTLWHKVPGTEKLMPEVVQVSDNELKHHKDSKAGTISSGRVVDPLNSERSWSMESIRGPDGLRRWSSDDIVPRSNDVLQERLYCIRWSDGEGNRRYAAPDDADIVREEKVLKLLNERFSGWQEEGFIPSSQIPKGGEKTEEPIRTRGWTHWHHLFTPRQLLVSGLIYSSIEKYHAFILPRIGNLADFNSRLTRYPSTRETINNTFSNQALNPVYNYPCRALSLCRNVFVLQANAEDLPSLENTLVKLSDARDLQETCDLWITDPPYADAINYDELSAFFLAWYDKQLEKAFPDWVLDTRSELAVRGDGEDFRRSMVEIYRNLAKNMPDNGMQMVMFTHQNPAVWADLGMILWAAGLKVTAAWTISTETEAAGIKKGNYVQGTVCLILRKRLLNEPGFMDEVYPLVEDEVKQQIGSMQALDEDAEPNFNDADYQLAAYAAALKILTQYGNLDGRDVEYEVFAIRARNEKSDFQTVIERALQIACDTLIPNGLENSWRDLTLVERYYLRALDIESRGERRKGMYEELARGFGVTDIKPLLKSDKANGARMFTPSGMAASSLAPLEGVEENSSESLSAKKGRAGGSTPHPFSSSSLRHLIFAVRETTVADNNPEPGRQYLRDTFGQMYWGRREGFVDLLKWLSALGNTEGMEEWSQDSEASRILSGRLRNDHA